VKKTIETKDNKERERHKNTAKLFSEYIIDACNKYGIESEKEETILNEFSITRALV
jgi:hypothetical protein